MKQTVLIIDDEEDARELLKIHLERHSQLQCVGEARNGYEALTYIEELKPDIVLLDIQMPELSGIEVVQRLDRLPLIVFITAYEAFAVQAFELNAVDYLLKPFSQERFDATISKVTARHGTADYQDLIASLSEAAMRSTQYLRRLPHRVGHRTVYVPVEEVIVIESADQYVEVHTAKDKYLLRLSMDYLNETLDPGSFFRCHRSFIIHLPSLLSIEQYEARNYLIHLEGGFQAKLSREKKDVLNALLTGR